MSVVVRPADLAEDRAALLAVLERNLPDLAHAKRFEWLYRDNPAGQAWAWLAVDGATGRVVGAASLIPRMVWIDGTAARCGQVADFAIDASHRSLGPAVALQRATLQPVAEGRLAFCYDCPPHARGMAPFRRLGLDTSVELRRYVRPLRADAALARRLPLPALARTVAPVANLLLRARPRGIAPDPALRVSAHEGPFGSEFSALDALARDAGTIRNRRAAEDLSWRFHRDPLDHYRALAARAGGALVGYAIYRSGGAAAALVDLFAPGHPAAGRQLLAAVLAEVRRGPAQVVHAVAPASGPLRRLLAAAGFRDRGGAARVVAYAAGDGAARALVGRPESWAFQRADIAA
jgi:hypothetical protein